MGQFGTLNFSFLEPLLKDFYSLFQRCILLFNLKFRQPPHILLTKVCKQNMRRQATDIALPCTVDNFI